MAIEKLYLTDTFRVWAEKFNATIDASNTATANAEKAVNKAEEALQKAEQAVNDSVKGDDITTIVNEERQVVAKDIAIGGDVNDLASKRGQIGNAASMKLSGEEYDLNNFINSGVYYFHQSNIPKNAPLQDDGICCVISFGNMTIQYYYTNTDSLSKYYIRNRHGNNIWEVWHEIITTYNKATKSLFGIVQPDNTTITIQNGIISAKTLGTLDGTTVVNNDFNNLTTAGRYFISTVKDTTINAPINVTADWWIDVFTYGEGSTKKIIQEARMHSTTSSSATSGVANYLARCCTGTTWGPWEYAYTQFAG